MPVAIDTNILVYAEGMDGPLRQAAALDVLAVLPGDEVVIPVQVLGELYAVLTRKARWSPAMARAAIRRWSARCVQVETTADILEAAMELAAAHRLAFWDSVVFAAAAGAGCDWLLTEDLQDGFAWRGVTARNPFNASPPR